jgi:hypothetical protein
LVSFDSAKFFSRVKRGDKQFDASADHAVRRASPFPPVPDSAQSSLVGDLRMVLDPTQPVPEQVPGKKI